MDALREDLIAKFLGARYAGRRFLRYAELEALGIVANRACLKLWIDAGAFPSGIKIAGLYGRTLVWSVPEVMQVLTARAAERDASPKNDKGAPSRERPSDDSDDPLAAGRNHEQLA